MATLEEIRHRLQQAQSSINASETTDPAEKKRRLKRLKELKARLRIGEDISRRDLKNALTNSEWEKFEEQNSFIDRENETLDEERPSELDSYLKKLRQADFYYARAESTNVSNRSRIDEQGKNGRQRLYAKAQRAYEQALEELDSQLNRADPYIENQIRSWLDRDFDYSTENAPALDPIQMPRIRNSRSQHNDKDNRLNKFERKRQNKIDAVANAIASLKI